MPHSEAQAWWADVQHVRETIERRRAGLADASAPRDAGTETRFARRAAAADAAIEDLDWTQVSATRAGGRADHAGRPAHSDGAASRARRPAADVGDRATARGRRDAEHLDTDGRRDHASRAHRATARDAAGRDEPIGAPLAPPSSRRTVEITGRTVAAPPLPRLVEVERRRPPRRTVERVGPRPDRVALWAVLLGFFLILVAATSSRAATTPAVHGHAGATVALHAPAR
jgi:hypothetical protein